VAQGYADRLTAHPQRFARIDASGNPEAVWQAVQQVFINKGWLA
jgi:thymidylate kinase